VREATQEPIVEHYWGLVLVLPVGRISPFGPQHGSSGYWGYSTCASGELSGELSGEPHQLLSLLFFLRETHRRQLVRASIWHRPSGRAYGSRPLAHYSSNPCSLEHISEDVVAHAPSVTGADAQRRILPIYLQQDI